MVSSIKADDIKWTASSQVEWTLAQKVKQKREVSCSITRLGMNEHLFS